MITESFICNSYGDVIWKTKGKYHQGLMEDFKEAIKLEHGEDWEKITKAIQDVKSKGIIPYMHKA